MKIPLLISALILAAFGLLCYAPDAVVGFKSPEPEPQWVPSGFDVIWWKLDRWKDCEDFRTDGVNRCSEFI